jgi:hypothetical protein
LEKPFLTVDDIIDRGFREVGCWELNSARDLIHHIDLPTQSGVYAFAINGVVHYVGLASKSLRQRLGFYRKPGASQRTNVRLNEVIRGHLEAGTLVQIFIAHPPDGQWNGFKLKGAEGLEAGLIETYDLPWNMRGAKQTVRAPVQTRRQRTRGSSLAEQILAVVRQRPGVTELDIAKALFGPSALQPQVNQDCRLLVQRGMIIRRGAGGRADPFTYALANKLDPGSSPG